jgi:hypothetical protein
MLTAREWIRPGGTSAWRAHWRAGETGPPVKRAPAGANGARGAIRLALRRLHWPDQSAATAAQAACSEASMTAAARFLIRTSTRYRSAVRQRDPS